MKRKLQFRKLAAVVCSLALSFSVFASSTPAADDGKWYYVKSQRYNTGGPWWTMGTSTCVPGALNKANNQKFTLVTAATGKITFKSYGTNGTDGLKLTADGGAGTWNATGAATGWTITPNLVGAVQGYAFPGENSGVHQGAGGWGWRVATSWYSLTDNCTFFFYEAVANADLNIAIDAAKEFKATVVVGTTPGTYPQAAVDAYTTAITTAEGNMTSTDATVLSNSVTALTAAKTTLLDAKVPPVTSSTDAAPIWYLIKNVGRALGETLYANGFDAQMKCNTTPVLADGTGTGNAAPGLKYLFRFEVQADKSYKIINALYPTGEALQAGSGGSSSQAVKYGTATGIRYNITVFTGATNPSLQFKIASVGNNTIWHDDGSHNIVSWDAAVGSASAWYFEQYTGTLAPLYAPALLTSITDATAAANNAVIGTDFGQIPQDAKTTLLDAVATAQTVYDNAGTKTVAEIMAAKATLDAAVVTFKAAMVSAKTVLLSTNPDNYRWYKLKNRMYATNDIITTNGIATDGTGGIVCQNVGTSNDNEMWRFEMNANQTAFKMVNKATGMAIKDNGTSTQATLVTVANATEFDLSRQDMFWAIGRVGASQYQYLHREAGSKIVGWEAAASASQWTLQYVEETSKYTLADFSSALTTARALYNNTVGGTEYAEFGTTARTNFGSVITTYEAIDQNTITSTQITNGIKDLLAATTAYNAAFNSTIDNTKWYTMESAKYPGKYLTLDPATKVLSIADKNNTDGQLFRFVKKAANGNFTNLHEISCRALTTGSIRCETDAWDVVYNTGTAFSGGSAALTLGYWPWNMTLLYGANGYQTKLMSIDWDGIGTNGTGVINELGDYGASSSWVIKFAQQDPATGLANVSKSDISACAVNGTIIVSGASDFSVYTVSGQKVRNKGLNKGIYLVKAASQTLKVTVK